MGYCPSDSLSSSFQFLQVWKELARISKNKDREVNRLDLEKLEFHHDVQKEYLALANEYKDRIIVIDASKSLEEVCEEAYKVIKGFLDR